MKHFKASPTVADRHDAARVLVAIAAGKGEPQAGPAIRARLDPPLHPLRLSRIIRLLSAEGEIKLGPGSEYNRRTWVITPKASEARTDGVRVERTPQGVRVICEQGARRSSTLLPSSASQADIDRAAARVRQLAGAA